MSQVFGVEPWRGSSGGNPVRKEDATVGRLVHQWVQRALNAAKEPRRLTRGRLAPGAFRRLGARASGNRETSSRRSAPRGTRRRRGPERSSVLVARCIAENSLGRRALPGDTCPKPLIALRRCEGRAVGTTGCARATPVPWVCLGKSFEGELATSEGPLHLRAHCDVLLLDRADLSGADCQFIDIRTGRSGGNRRTHGGESRKRPGTEAGRTAFPRLGGGCQSRRHPCRRRASGRLKNRLLDASARAASPANAGGSGAETAFPGFRPAGRPRRRARARSVGESTARHDAD